MEIRDYVRIFRQKRKIFLAVIALSMLIGWGYDFMISRGYAVALSLDVARSGGQETVNYKYDGFYRLQADERFADTLVRWLGSPRMVVNILMGAGLEEPGLTTKKLAQVFKAQRLSSQYILVEYSAQSPAEAKKVANSVVKVLNRKTEELNQLQQEAAWFVVLAGEPVIRQRVMTPVKTTLISVLGGIFLGLWSVMLSYYLAPEKEKW